MLSGSTKDSSGCSRSEAWEVFHEGGEAKTCHQGYIHFTNEANTLITGNSKPEQTGRLGARGG